MAIDLVNAGAASFASSTASFYVNYPASIDSFQFVMMQIRVADIFTTPTCSASWVLFHGPDSDTGGRQFLYYRWGTTTLGGSSTTVAFGTATPIKAGRIYGFSGVATASTVYEAGQYISSSCASMHCGEVTATVGSFTCLGVATYQVNDDNNVGNFVGAVGATWTKKYQASTTLGTDCTIGVQVATISSPPVTVTTATYTMAAADLWGVRTFLLIGSATIPAASSIINQAYLYQFELSSS